MSPSVAESYLEQLHADLLELSSPEDGDGGGEPPPPRRGLGDATHPFSSTRWSEPDESAFGALADFLFETLRQQFGWLLAPSGAPETEEQLSRKGFVVLLRCCMVALRILEFDPKLMAAKIEILLGMLRTLRELAQSRPLRSGTDEAAGPDGRNGNGEEGEEMPIVAFFASVIEVFINEILLHSQLQNLFSTDCLSATTEKSSGENDGYSLQEIVYSHFLLSTHDDWMVGRYVQSFSWVEPVNDVPELCLNAALKLLGMCGASSVPLMIQAHIMLSVSRCINIPKDSIRFTEELKNSCTLAFGQSVNLYVRCVSSLDFFKKSIESEDQSYCFASELSFDSFIKPSSCCGPLPNVGFILDLCHLNCLDVLSGTKADVFSNSLAYVRDNQQVINEQCREQSILILKYIISSVLEEKIEETRTCEAQNGSQHETFYLLSVLKLMGSSLLQIIWNLRQKGHTTSKEMSVSEILCCFCKFEANHLVKKIFLAFIGSHPFKCKETVLMIAHFASLLLYSFRKRLGLLWKSCILMMMTVLNLLLLEESNLDISLLGTAPAGPQEDSVKVPAFRISSTIIASKIQDIRKLYLQDDSLSITSRTKQPVHVVSGESFIRVLPCYQKNPSEWADDLIDFIGCTPGKNYSSWLKNLKTFKKSHHKNITKKIPSRTRFNTVMTPRSGVHGNEMRQKLNFKKRPHRW